MANDTQISDDRARTFADGLQTFEKDGDAATFAALFADDATTQRLDARLTDGRPIQYRGVTVITLDGEKISKLRTYYDSAQFAAIPADTA